MVGKRKNSAIFALINLMLTLNDITIGYRDKTVAQGLTATLHRGCLTCLVGANGTGKSTLLRTITAFQRPLAGTVTMQGKDMHGCSRQEQAALTSVVLTGRPAVRLLTVREVVSMGRAPYTGMWGRLTAEDESVVEESIALVGIEGLAERSIQTLSDGECQKVMIAKALAQQTPLVVLDEPTAFLDYPSKVETLLLMKRLVSDGTRAVLLSTHDMELALRLADELWLMTRDGRLLSGTAEELAEPLANEQLIIKNEQLIINNGD